MIQVGMPEGLAVFLIVLSYIAGMLVGSWVTDRRKLTLYWEKGKTCAVHYLPEWARHYGKRLLLLQEKWRASVSKVLHG